MRVSRLPSATFGLGVIQLHLANGGLPISAAMPKK
jgi:hypothetical protein